MRFGMDDNEPKTLGQIGRALGVSGNRIRQIEATACKSLRRLIPAQALMVLATDGKAAH